MSAAERALVHLSKSGIGGGVETGGDETELLKHWGKTLCGRPLAGLTARHVIFEREKVQRLRRTEVCPDCLALAKSFHLAFKGRAARARPAEG